MFIFDAQSIGCAPYFWGITLRIAIITDSVSHTESVITDCGAVAKAVCLGSGDRGIEARSGLHVSKKHYISSPLNSVGSFVTER